ncbi:MAG: hypothetical protein M1830_003702 [Pleopsidium flavum]|nr:MAG: hypothetical protein M1830_007757 [Pleopsidium flavum]KAI9880385.1 MAG: hypothetical protein M1830_003702 [Pleopsidium flavum]
MDICITDIALPESDRVLSDIRLHSPRPSNGPILPPKFRLCFLSYVDPTLIPLYLAAGPCLDVWTENEDTEQYFEEILLCNSDEDTAMPWWRAHLAQSNIGILVQVDDLQEEHKDNGQQARPRVTELLIYGTISNTSPQPNFLTPPASSSPGPEQSHNVQDCGSREVRVHALPLSSDLLYRGDQKMESQADSTPLSPTRETPGSPTAYFLPPLYPQPSAGPTSARKRQRVATLFDDAAQRNKKARRKGGESVSKAMASIEGSQSQAQKGPLSCISRQRDDSKKTAKINVEDELGLSIGDQERRPLSWRGELSRSSSISSIQENGSGRPSSRKGALAEGKRSSLHRATSILTANNGSLVPEEEKTVEQRNKDTLSRIIMAGMRLYGLQQRKRTSKSRAVSEAPSQFAIPDVVSKPAEDSDEYKLIYHQTFKGASFALRQHITTSLVKQVVMREVADKLLAIFCADPLSECTDAPNHGFGGDGKTETSPFAPASGRANLISADGGYSTPKVRGRYRDGDSPGDQSCQRASSPDIFHTPGAGA